MNPITKIMLTVIGAIVLIALSACSTVEVINDDHQRVTSAASEIADFDLPTGYGADFSARLMGYTVAAFNPGDGYSHLYLIQSEDEADGEELAQMLDELAPGASDPQTRMTVVEIRPVTVRGQETTLVISEGVNSEGVAYRQAIVVFQGKGGPALLVLSEPVTRWNQETMDAFIASIR